MAPPKNQVRIFLLFFRFPGKSTSEKTIPPKKTAKKVRNFLTFFNFYGLRSRVEEEEERSEFIIIYTRRNYNNTRMLRNSYMLHD